MKHFRHIYVFENQRGNVKIGVSQSVDVRKRAVQSQSGCKIIRSFSTEKCSNPLEIERLAHDYFSDKRLFGEWFSIPYNKAVSVVSEFYGKYAKFEERKSDPDILDGFKRNVMERLKEIKDTEEQIGQLLEISSGLLEKGNKLCDMLEETNAMVNFLLEENKRLVKKCGECKKCATKK